MYRDQLRLLQLSAQIESSNEDIAPAKTAAEEFHDSAHNVPQLLEKVRLHAAMHCSVD